MTCVKCQNDFNPRLEPAEQVGGYGDTVEMQVRCPTCDAAYSHWIEPKDWTVQDE